MNTLSEALAALDGVVLVVAADRGIETRTRESLLLARQAGVRSVVVFLSRTDQAAGHEAVDRVELAVRHLLNQLEYPGDDIPVLRGDALAAFRSAGQDEEVWRPIEGLVGALDMTVRVEPGDPEAPLLIPVGRGGSLNPWNGEPATPRSKRIHIHGRVVEGRVEVGQEVDLVCIAPRPVGLVVHEIAVFDQFRQKVGPGHTVRLILVAPSWYGDHRLPDVSPAGFIAAPGSAAPKQLFRALLTVTDRGEGLGGRSLRLGMAPSFWIGTARSRGRIVVAPGRSVPAGTTGYVTVQLEWPCYLREGQFFACRHRNAVIAHGSIEKVLD
jgi:elongation factor Tu